MDEKRRLDSEELFRRYARFVASFLTWMGVRCSDLDDMVQDVFLIAHREGGYRPSKASPIAFLAGIAMGICSVYTRRQKVKKRLALGSGALERSSIEESDQRETFGDEACFCEALDTLDPEERAVFVLAEIEGENCTSIASGLHISAATVHQRLQGARQLFCAAARVAVDKSRTDVRDHTSSV
jgi:RNA polymerase sigma-70 factor, ECF subfamily